MQSSRADSSGRIRIVTLGAAGFFLFTFASQAWVQTFGAYGIQEKANKSKRFVTTLDDKPRRGRIFSSDKQILARDDGVYALNVNFSRVPKSAGFFMDLGAATGMSGTEIREIAERKKGNAVWPATMDADAKKRVEAVKAKWRADGVSADPSGMREYPFGAATSSIVGILGASDVSKGIEKSFASQVAGQAGKARGLVDRTGAFLPMRMEQGGTPRIDGTDVVLTIDSVMQQVAFDSVKRAVEHYQAESGVAIVMDPAKGDILAMANWPTFDPRTGQGPDGGSADINQAVMSRWEPGSTMKPFTQAKAIEDGKIGPSWHWQCAGSLVKGSASIQCDSHGGNRAHGAVDMEKAIAVSCNVSAAQWACEIGFDGYKQFITDLGLLEPLEIGLPNTVSGRVFIEPVAKTQELMCWGFGQSMSVTPLALGAAFCSFGNDGLWMKPRLIKSVGSKEYPRAEGNRVFSPQTTRQVMKYMEEVIESEHGTGRTVRIPGYRLAGKTGTAQRMGRKGGGYVSNFVGFVPAEQPKAMILVMIDHPRRYSYYGATVAGPVFKDIAKAVIRRYELKPTSGTQRTMPTPQLEVQVQR